MTKKELTEKLTRLSADERKLSILSAAVPLFAMQGFQGTTTKQLAKAAGVSEALLYKHFPSKEDLFEKLKDFACSETFIRAHSLMKMEAGTLTVVHYIYFLLHAMVIGTHLRPGENTDTCRLMLYSILDDARFAKIFIGANFLPWFPLFSKAFQASVKSGDMIDGGISSDNKVWFVHHTAVTLLMNRVNQFCEYNMNIKELVAEASIFSLRGIGLKKEAIDKYFDAEALYNFAQGVMNSPPEEVDYEKNDDCCS